MTLRYIDVMKYDVSIMASHGDNLFYEQPFNLYKEAGYTAYRVTLDQ